MLAERVYETSSAAMEESAALHERHSAASLGEVSTSSTTTITHDNDSTLQGKAAEDRISLLREEIGKGSSL